MTLTDRCRNLTLFLPDIFRAELVNPQLPCRWLVDGVNDELYVSQVALLSPVRRMYFNVTGSHASSIVFMGMLFDDSHEAPDRYRNVSYDQIERRGRRL